jgi:hypothetical protein
MKLHSLLLLYSSGHILITTPHLDTIKISFLGYTENLLCPVLQSEKTYTHTHTHTHTQKNVIISFSPKQHWKLFETGKSRGHNRVLMPELLNLVYILCGHWQFLMYHSFIIEWLLVWGMQKSHMVLNCELSNRSEIPSHVVSVSVRNMNVQCHRNLWHIHTYVTFL